MEKKYRLIWGVCLILIGIGTVILMGSSIIGVELPDMARRVIGVVDLVGLFGLGFSSVKIFKGEG